MTSEIIPFKEPRPLEPGSTRVLVVFGIDNTDSAANLLDEMANEDSQ